MAAFLFNLSQVAWPALVGSILLMATTSTFLGLFISVAVHEVFEAQTFSNFFRFPVLRLFTGGLFAASLWNIRRKWVG